VKHDAVSTSMPASIGSRVAPDPPATLPGLSIVLPCFNEADNLPCMLAEARKAAKLVADEWELIVVDDGSSDGTFGVAAGAAAWQGGVRVIAHERNLGYGAAVRSGIEAARMPWVFLTDADLQFDLRELARFVPLTAHADVVMGRRAQRADSLYRRLSAEAWNLLVRALFRLPVRDVDCAFKLIRRDVLESLELNAGGAMISTELIVKLSQRGARVVERDVTHRPRPAGEQSGGNLKVIARAFAELVRMRRTLGAS
jgi:glycosyltransferase involved in cell wall biosynthesis